jgi:hypothetical protein
MLSILFFFVDVSKGDTIFKASPRSCQVPGGSSRYGRLNLLVVG